MLQPSPLSSSSSLTGQLFNYGANRVAFESLVSASPSAVISSLFPSIPSSPVMPPPNKCILLGGLSDGLIPVPYTQALSEMLCQFPDQPVSLFPDRSVEPSEAPPPPEQTWSLVQPILSSSYTGFGHGTLDRDVKELHELIQYLVQHRNATHNILLVGHSTGCQQIVHYFKTYHDHRVTAAVLQAPVSDREAATIWNPQDSPYGTPMEHEEQLQKHVALAKEMTTVQRRGHEMMPRAAFWAPITAQRYYDLMVPRHGLDDYFSSDYTNDELQERLSHLSSSTSLLRRVVVAYSGQDEYVPSHVDKPVLLQRLCNAMNHRVPLDDVDDDIHRRHHGEIAQPLYLPEGNHNLSSHDETTTTFLQQIYHLLTELTTTTTTTVP